MDLQKKMRDGRHQLWLMLARRGNEDAFRRLYRELYGPVAGYIAARVPNPQDAEDLVSEVFGKFLDGMGSYQVRRGSVMTWVVAMARNRVIDYHRRLKAHGGARSETIPTDDLADVLAAGVEDPLGSMIRREELRRLHCLLRREPAEIREMFALRFGQGLSLKEVAKVMDLSEAAIKQRFSRTMQRIRQELLTEEHGTERKGGPECMIAE